MPGGRCITFDRTHRRISFTSRPFAVAGAVAKGRFALFGGPHIFETGTYGLLDEAGNRRFLDQLLAWGPRSDHTLVRFPSLSSASMKPDTPPIARVNGVSCRGRPLGQWSNGKNIVRPVLF